MGKIGSIMEITISEKQQEQLITLLKPSCYYRVLSFGFQ